MLWLKTCPRCHGDLVLESDIHGQYASCIQCGAEFSEGPVARVSGASRHVPPLAVVIRGARGSPHAA